MAKDLGYDQSMITGPQSANVKSFIQNDYARLDIFYQTLNVKAIEQEPAISVSIKKPISSNIQNANVISFNSFQICIQTSVEL